MDDEKLNEELEEMETASIMLTDEDGKDTMFEFLDLIKYEDNEYIVLSPIYEEDEEVEDEGHVVILRLDEETEDGGETYSSVDDDSIIEAVYNIFKEKWKNLIKVMENRKTPAKEISELKNEKEQILERIFKTKEKIKESPWKKKIEKDKSKGLGRG